MSRRISDEEYRALTRKAERLLAYLTVVCEGALSQAAHFAPLAKEQAEELRALLEELRRSGPG